MRDIPLLAASGTTFDCGQSIGRALRTDIHANIVDYGNIFLRRAGADRDQVRRFALTLVPAIEAYAPELVEEIRGLARGVEVEFADILALNARTEIMYGLAASECTSVGLHPELARAGHTMIGENWDWLALVAGRTVVLALQQPGKPRTLVFNEPKLRAAADPKSPFARPSLPRAKGRRHQFERRMVVATRVTP